MIGTKWQDAFISRCIIAVVTTLRHNADPASSMVGFARNGDRLLFSTDLDKLKGKTLLRDPRLVACVLNPREPWSFVSVEGRVTIHLDNPIELRTAMLDAWVGHPDNIFDRADNERLMAGPSRAIFELVPDRVSGVVFPA